MNTFPICEATVWIDASCLMQLTRALIHFLWQGCAIALAYLLISGALRRAPAGTRYTIGVVFLLGMAACLPATLWLLRATPTQPHPTVAAETGHLNTAPVPDSNSSTPAIHHGTVATAQDMRRPMNAEASHPARLSADANAPPARRDTTERLATILPEISPYAAIMYLIGVLLMLLRVVVGLWGGRRLRRISQPILDGDILDTVRRQARRIGMRVFPAVAYCGRISAPVVVGVLRPMILLPGSLVSGLTFSQLEAVILHELAHIRRFDLAISVIQRLVEAMLFFHPAVWWLSHQIQHERENACDDLAALADGNRVRYAEALVRMAELCVANRAGSGALAAMGTSGSQFKRRILRLLGIAENSRLRLKASGAAVAALFIVAITLAPIAFHLAMPAVHAETADRSDLHGDPLGKGTHATAEAGAKGSKKSPEPAGKLCDSPAGREDSRTKFIDKEGRTVNGAQPNVDQAKAIAAIKELSGYDVTLDENSPGKPAKAVFLENSKVTDAGLVHLAGLTQLQVLSLKTARVTDAGLVNLKGLTQLHYLDLRGTNVTGTGLEHLKGLTRLKWLLMSSPVTDAGLVHLKGLPGLQWLGLAFAPVTDAGLVHLKGLTGLQILDLGGTGVTDAGLAHLKGLTALEMLDLAATNVTDAGLVHLKGLKKLQHLNLSFTKVRGAGLVHLRGLSKLQVLNLGTTEVNDTGLEHLKGLAALQWLVLMQTKVTDAGLVHLEGLPQLRDLDLCETQVTDAGLVHLKSLTKLRSLDLRDTKVTDAGLAELHESLPNCKVNEIRERPIPECVVLVSGKSESEYYIEAAFRDGEYAEAIRLAARR